MQRSAIYLKLALRDYENDLVTRVTDGVLNALSVRADVTDAVRKIDSLNDAIKRLGE